jgi:glycosyltransferase involved in cell wall biosynthesis
VVVPVFDEEENAEPLVGSVCEALLPLGRSFELVVVDDGSRDGTLERLKALIPTHPQLVVVALRRNFGQTPALQAGFDRACGDIIVTMDGDLQNDPGDIPRLIERIDAGADVVSGWRVDRQDTLVLRKVPSWIANRMIRWVTGVPVHDQGCSLKAYRAEVVRRLGLYSDMHRFITVMTMPLGAAIEEIEVRHHPRVAGTSKYGISRVFKVLADLLTIQLITRFRESPMRWFAAVGAPFLLGSLAFAIGSLFVMDRSIVMPTVSLLLGLIFVSCLFAGVMGEAIIDLSAREVPRRDVGVREWETQS